MRIGAVLARLLLVAGLAVMVASPSFVDRRAPGFAELFGRFRASDVSVIYVYNPGEGPRVRLRGEGIVRLTKSGDSYLRIDGADFSSRVDTPFFLEKVPFFWLITPKSATYCSWAESARASSSPNCIIGSPQDGELIERLIAQTLLLPRGLSQQTVSWSRRDDRVVLGLRSSCFRATPLDEGTFDVCLTDRGELLYSSVDDGYGQRAIEATSVEHPVDMSVFDEKKFLQEN